MRRLVSKLAVPFLLAAVLLGCASLPVLAGGVNLGNIRSFVQAIFNGTIDISGQATGDAIVWNGSAWASGSAGVSGPGVSTDNAIVRWDGVNGDTLQNSVVTISDAGTMSLPAGARIEFASGTRLAGGGSFIVTDLAGTGIRVSCSGLISNSTLTMSPANVDQWEFMAAGGHFRPVNGNDSTLNLGSDAVRVLGTYTDFTVNQRLLVNTTPVTLSATGPEFVEVDVAAVGGDVTINLPAVATTPIGRRYVIKDNGGATLLDTVIVDGNGGELIDASATKTISTAYGSYVVVNNGTKWLVE